MKKLLSILSILTLASTSIGTTISTNVNNNTQISNNNSSHVYEVKYIDSPIGNKTFLRTPSGFSGWSYLTINLGNMKQEQIMGIGSRDNDSYSDHTVESYNYYYKDDKAGIHHGPNFRNYFFNDKVTSSWRYSRAANNAKENFKSITKWGLAEHTAIGTIKFLWHYNSNSELLIQIVVTLTVVRSLSTVDGVSSTHLGSCFRIFHTN